MANPAIEDILRSLNEQIKAADIEMNTLTSNHYVRELGAPALQAATRKAALQACRDLVQRINRDTPSVISYERHLNLLSEAESASYLRGRADGADEVMDAITTYRENRTCLTKPEETLAGAFVETVVDAVDEVKKWREVKK